MTDRVFDVILRPEPEGGYSAHVPTLPGCFSQGETIEEATEGIKEAIGLYLEELEIEGRPLPLVEIHERVVVAA
ncbi:MAG TPA: type II toxin-antitoxin system HicB family antitoxin [Mycobacteriales bacterium]|nr:type II toxin-antitoxin system HicB family antitoxin [Mycobacteriales bacterium]